MKDIKVIFIHGNGGSSCQDNWFPSLKKELENLQITVIDRDFPDKVLAREKYWIPFLKNELKADENSIIVGHSSGAIAAMRYAETHKILGSVLVGTYHTHLGYDTEKISGYFDRPWNWQAIRNNQQWVAIFASTDDKWIPIEEPRFVSEQLQADYFEFNDQGHFGGDRNKPTFPELLMVIKQKLGIN